MTVHHKGAQDDFTFEVADIVRPPDATHCLRCGYHNLLGLTQQDIKGKVEASVVPIANKVLAPLGWQYVGVGVFGDYYEIYYKEASPAVAITTGLLIAILTTICVLVLGIVVVWVTWVYLETKKDLAQAKADKKKLLEEGKITKEQYTSLIEAQAKEDMLAGLGDLLKWGLIAVIVLAVVGAIGKGREGKKD